jgi:hypothetical protein|tara:strand:+ start:128 stop:478 length:351 start_codon:yes stop_codon:yes gene_type:complete
MDGTLILDGGRSIKVLHFDYTTKQAIDETMRVTGEPTGGEINMLIKSINDGNTDFLEWVGNPYTTKGGSFEFEKRDGTNMKTLKFEDAYLLDYKESYDSIDKNLQDEIFTISVKKY